MSLTGIAVATLVTAALLAVPAHAELPAVPGALAQRLPAPLRVNGVAIDVQRFAGETVPALALATAREWGVAAQRQGSWWQLARVQGELSEVLQWRQSDTGHEALYSRLRLTPIHRNARQVDLALPPACGDDRQLDVGEARQPVLHLTARCSGPSTALREAVQRSASRAGWRPVAVDASTLHWARPGWQLQVQLLPTAQEIALLALQWPAGGTP